MWLNKLANKSFYRVFSLISVAVFLSACGFQLRGTQTANLSQKTILIESESPFGQVEKALKQQLQQSGAKLVAIDESPQLHLKLLKFEINSQGASRDATGRANEVILRARLEYQLMTAEELHSFQKELEQGEEDSAELIRSASNFSDESNPQLLPKLPKSS